MEICLNRLTFSSPKEKNVDIVLKTHTNALMEPPNREKEGEITNSDLWKMAWGDDFSESEILTKCLNASGNNVHRIYTKLYRPSRINLFKKMAATCLEKQEYLYCEECEKICENSSLLVCARWFPLATLNLLRTYNKKICWSPSLQVEVYDLMAEKIIDQMGIHSVLLKESINGHVKLLRHLYEVIPDRIKNIIQIELFWGGKEAKLCPTFLYGARGTPFRNFLDEIGLKVPYKENWHRKQKIFGKYLS